jgi:hypothetical protein
MRRMFLTDKPADLKPERNASIVSGVLGPVSMRVTGSSLMR